MQFINLAIIHHWLNIPSYFICSHIHSLAQLSYINYWGKFKYLEKKATQECTERANSHRQVSVPIAWIKTFSEYWIFTWSPAAENTLYGGALVAGMCMHGFANSFVFHQPDKSVWRMVTCSGSKMELICGHSFQCVFFSKINARYLIGKMF